MPIAVPSNRRYMWSSNKTLLLFNTNFSDLIIKSFVHRWGINSCFLCNQQLIASIPIWVGIEVYKVEISHEYIVLSKGIFVGNFLEKSQSSFIDVLKMWTRGFSKISIKLLVVLGFLDHHYCLQFVILLKMRNNPQQKVIKWWKLWFFQRSSIISCDRNFTENY